MTKISLIESIYYASKGLFKEILFERNIKILILFSILVLSIAFVFNVSLFYFLILFLACSYLILLEILNHFYEKLLDLLCPGYNKRVGQLKDHLAGMVLFTLIIVLITSFIILFKPILILFEILSQNLILSSFFILNFVLLVLIDFVIFRKSKLKKAKLN